MADVNLPFDVEAEIMKRLPVKSLTRFTSVSKPWRSLIHSSKFIHDHHVMHSHHHFLLRYYDQTIVFKNMDDKYMSIGDADTFPRHETCMTIPTSVNLRDNCPKLIVGSSGGLFCFINFNRKINDSRTCNAIIWNPTIKKSVAVDLPNMLRRDFHNTVVGFGVSSLTSDLTLVKITFDSMDIPSLVEVFTLSLGYWRSPRSNLPRKSIRFEYKQVVINEFIYWRAYHSFLQGRDNLVMSFNMTSEEFTEVYFPASLASSKGFLSISKLRESLVVVENNGQMSNVTVWILQNCGPKSFTKLFTFDAPNISGFDKFVFRSSGELIIIKRNYSQKDELFVYESNSQQVNYFWIRGDVSIVYVTPYIETLLLFNISKSKRRGSASKVWRLMKSC